MVIIIAENVQLGLKNCTSSKIIDFEFELQNLEFKLQTYVC